MRLCFIPHLEVHSCGTLSIFLQAVVKIFRSREHAQNIRPPFCRPAASLDRRSVGRLRCPWGQKPGFHIIHGLVSYTIAVSYQLAITKNRLSSFIATKIHIQKRKIKKTKKGI